MIGGVNFQPGAQAGTQRVRPKSGNSVQEAIKILSLRLPTQVGPNALAPAALLNAQGSNGNSRIDSVVSTVMGRMFPQGQPEQPPQPLVPSASSPMPASAPQFSGDSRPADTTPLSSMMPTGTPEAVRVPRITAARQGPTPGPGPVPQTPLPPQPIDVTPPAQPSDPVAPAEPTQDPWTDLMNYIRSKTQTPMTPEQML